MRDNMDDLKNKNSLDFVNPARPNAVPGRAAQLKGEKVAEETRKDNVSTSGPNGDEEFSLNDDRRVKVLSPGAMVTKRFFRNRLAVTGLTILIFMFLFSFVGGFVSPYDEDEKFFRIDMQNKEYAGVIQNTEWRFAEAEGQEFGGAVQAFAIQALKAGDSSFTYRDVTYEVTEEGENFCSVSTGGNTIGIAFQDIVNLSNEGESMSFDFRYNVLKAYTNGDASFTADGKNCQIDEAGLITCDGQELGYVSSFIVQAVMPDVFLTRDFKEQVTAAIEAGQENFIYTGVDGATHEYSISYDPDTLKWSVKQLTETQVFDTYSAPSKAHWLGTDRNGMDMLTRLMYGGRVSLMIGFIVVIISAAIGVTLGGIAGYFGGWVDNMLMRLVDVFYCIPSTPIIIILGAAMDAMRVDPTIRMVYLMLILGVLGWAGIARLVRGQILSLREQEFMTATESCGISVSRRIFRHLIPNVIPQLIVTCTMSLGSTIITEATLSFLGLGVKFPFASWGNIINDVNNTYVLTTYWFIWIPAGVCLLLTVLAFNLVGDGLRDAFDPKMKR